METTGTPNGHHFRQRKNVHSFVLFCQRCGEVRRQSENPSGGTYKWDIYMRGDEDICTTKKTNDVGKK